MKNKGTRGVLSILITLAMIFALLPALALTANAAPVSGSLTIGAESVPDLLIDGSGTNWSWDAATATLTLTGNIGSTIFFDNTGAGAINITYSGNFTVDGGTDIAIQVNGTANLQINGSGTLTLVSTNWAGIFTQQGNINIIGGSTSVVINAAGDGIWSGGGNVNISGGAAVDITSTGIGRGIYANNHVIIIGNGTSVEIETTDGYGIDALATVTINSGTVTINAAGGGVWSTGGGIRSIGPINITGGTVTINATGIGIGTASGVNIFGGTVTINSAGDGIGTASDVNISGGTVNITSTGSDDGINAGGDVTISGGSGIVIGGVLAAGGLTHPGVAVEGSHNNGATWSAAQVGASGTNNVFVNASGVEFMRIRWPAQQQQQQPPPQLQPYQQQFASDDDREPRPDTLTVRYFRNIEPVELPWRTSGVRLHEIYAVRSEVPTRAGFEFLYWTTSREGGGAQFTAGGGITARGDINLYAQWRATGPVTAATLPANINHNPQTGR